MTRRTRFDFTPGLPKLSYFKARHKRAKPRSRVHLLTVAFSPIMACSGMPEQHAYDIADSGAEWLDKFSVDERACATAGGVIVQERYQPDSIRVGGSGPEVGTRYYCRY